MTDNGRTPESLDIAVAAEGEVDLWGDALAPDEPRSLADLVNRVLDRGVVISGDITISVAGVDLVYLQLHALLTSISTARRHLRAGPGSQLEGRSER